MTALRVDSEQRFTCSQCGRCCRGPWQIVITPSEAETYRKRGAVRWYRERALGAEGSERDPFEPIPGTRGFQRIRKRDDGACGFLSPENRCRLHEELGGARKPLTCRMFPYRFHPLEGSVLVTTSFCCPTTIASSGALVSAQLQDVKALSAEWFAVYPEKPARVSFTGARSIDASTLATLKDVLHRMLDRPAPGGEPPDLRANVLRMGVTLEDLARRRVVRLPDEAFAEYVSLTGRYAATTEKAVASRRASLVGRLLQRGFLFAVAATWLQRENAGASGLRPALRLLRLLLHFHSLAPAASGVQLGAVRRMPVDVNAAELRPIARHFLRANIEALGTGRRPVLEEMALALSYLNAACDLAAMKADAAGRRVDAALFSEALMEAVDLTHAADRGSLGRILGTLSAGPDALFAFASRPIPE